MGWWRGAGRDGARTDKGLVGVVVGLIGNVVGKRRGAESEGGRRQGLSPFDDSMTATGPAVPGLAREARPGRTRTFNGHGGLGLPTAGGQRMEYEPLRGNGRGEARRGDRPLRRQ